MVGQQIAVVGAGAMGFAAIGALLRSGMTVRAVDASADTRGTLHDTFKNQIEQGSLAVFGDVSEVEQEFVSTALLFLPTERVIRSVLAPTGDFRPIGSAATVIDLGTNSAAFAREMAEMSAPSDVSYLDAPVLGRPDKVGNWVVPIGGDRDAYTRVVPILDAVAVNAPYVGPPGSGATLKLLNQLMFGAINAAAAEIAAVADAAGLDTKILFETITGSSAATVSSLFRDIGKRVVAGDYESPTFTLDLLAKDVGLTRELARSVGVDATVIENIYASTKRACDLGLGSQDTAAAWKALRGSNETPQK